MSSQGRGLCQGQQRLCGTDANVHRLIVEETSQPVFEVQSTADPGCLRRVRPNLRVSRRQVPAQRLPARLVAETSESMDGKTPLEEILFAADVLAERRGVCVCLGCRQIKS